MSIEQFRGMKREKFLGSPDIIPRASCALSKVPATGTAVPFLDGKYTAAYGALGGNVFDGRTLIASFRYETSLAVHEKYRGQGIAQELVYQMVLRSGKPLKARGKRSPTGQAVFENVWARIQAELVKA